MSTKRNSSRSRIRNKFSNVCMHVCNALFHPASHKLITPGKKHSSDNKTAPPSDTSPLFLSAEQPIVCMPYGADPHTSICYQASVQSAAQERIHN